MMTAPNCNPRWTIARTWPSGRWPRRARAANTGPITPAAPSSPWRPRGAQRQRTGGDWFDFLKPLLRQPDGVLSREEWLSGLTRVSRDPSLRGDVERLLDQGAADPSAVIARLFQRTGVAFRMENGRVVLS